MKTLHQGICFWKRALPANVQAQAVTEGVKESCFVGSACPPGLSVDQAFMGDEVEYGRANNFPMRNTLAV